MAYYIPAGSEAPADTQANTQADPDVYVPESALWKIKNPVFLLAADGDEACTKEQAEWIDKELNTAETKQLRIYENADHDFFTWSNQVGFANNVLSNIEGSASAAVSNVVISTAVISFALLAAIC